MRSSVVVVSPPLLNSALPIFQIGEPALVKAFVSWAAIEAFGERILNRLTGIDESQACSAPVGPDVEHPAGELGSVVAYYLLRHLRKAITFRLPVISPFSYSGTELDAVSEATNYYAWIMDSFSAAIGRQVVEAGAGTGTVSALMLSRAALDELILIEPATNNIPALHRRFDGDSRVRIHFGYLADIASTIRADTVLAVNVLEHVYRDSEFLLDANKALVRGGALLLLVPAVPAIYGSLDLAFEHHRRYTHDGLKKSLVDAGFEIEKLHYLNLVGVAAWFVAGRIMHRKTLGRGQVRFYDRLVIPWLRRLESLIHPPIGQSLLAIARKPTARPNTFLK